MQRESAQYRAGWVLLIALGVVLLTRLPVMPRYLFSFDSVNLALGLEDFNPARSQPQPPGYPFFIGEGKLLSLAFPDPVIIFTLLKLAVAALVLALMFWLGQAVRSRATGVVAAALVAFAPTFWYASLTSALRMHLALSSALVGLLLWRALARAGEDDAASRRWFYAAAFALGVAGGYRPEAELALTPLLLWTGWRLGGWRMAARGIAWMIPPTLLWLGVLVMALGGPEQVLALFWQYATEQGSQSSVLIHAPQMGWRRMAVRAGIWTFIGALAWGWALPLILRKRAGWTGSRRLFEFLCWWFVPAFLFNALVHTADPDHTLLTLPALCLLGALAVARIEESIAGRRLALSHTRGMTVWTGFLALLPLLFVFAEPRGKNLAMWGALAVGLLLIRPRLLEAEAGAAPSLQLRYPLVLLSIALNLLLFFTEFPLPAGRLADGNFHPLRSAWDALLIGTYETSYRRVGWNEEMTEVALRDIEKMHVEERRDLVIVWTRDGAPEWRKLAYYFPNLPVAVLEESGDPAVPATRAVLWRGRDIERQLRGAAPIRVDVPAGGRLVWLLAGGREEELRKVTALSKAYGLFYTDLPAGGASFQWGSFEFVAPPASEFSANEDATRESRPAADSSARAAEPAPTPIARR